MTFGVNGPWLKLVSLSCYFLRKFDVIISERSRAVLSAPFCVEVILVPSLITLTQKHCYFTFLGIMTFPFTATFRIQDYPNGWWGGGGTNSLYWWGDDNIQIYKKSKNLMKWRSLALAERCSPWAL